MDEHKKMMSEACEEVKKDFIEALKAIDFNAYDSCSWAFKSALSKGQMWLLLHEMLETGSEYNGVLSDIDEELKGAEKYSELYHQTGKSFYRDMAGDELKHAGWLIEAERNAGHSVSALDELKKKHGELAGRV